MPVRWIAKLGQHLLSASRPVLSPSSSRCIASMAFPVNSSILKPVSSDSFSAGLRDGPLGLAFYPPTLLIPAIQARFYAAKERSRAPLTPVTSKVKKYKLKSYSSFKFRFRTMHDGQIRRWRAGKRHNAHLKHELQEMRRLEEVQFKGKISAVQLVAKTKKAKRRLRRPEVVHPAYAKVIKKLNFCG